MCNLRGRLATIARDLAIRHVEFGVQPAHYPVVGEALLGTFADLLGPDFTPETDAAWAKAYGGLQDFMIAAAYPEPALSGDRA